jgi:hypothetical protein
VSNLPRSVGWYADRFGLRTTDVLTAGPETTRWLPSFDSTGGPSRSITTRSSCSRAGSPSPPLRVRDPGRRGRDLAQLAARPRLDALVRRGPTPAGQPGLRLLARPLGRKHEHFADGDLFTGSHETERHPIDRSPMALWGPEPPPDFVE